MAGGPGALEDNPFVLGPRPLLIPKVDAPPGAGSAGPAAAQPATRDPERVRIASAQFAGEVRVANAATRLDPVIPARAREAILIQARVAQERARGTPEQAENLEALSRELGASAASGARARRYEFTRSTDGTTVQVRVQDLEGGRVVKDQATTPVRYNDAREFFDRLAGPTGARLDPGRSLFATVPVADSN